MPQSPREASIWDESYSRIDLPKVYTMYYINCSKEPSWQQYLLNASINEWLSFLVATGPSALLLKVQLYAKVLWITFVYLYIKVPPLLGQSLSRIAIFPERYHSHQGKPPSEMNYILQIIYQTYSQTNQ